MWFPNHVLGTSSAASGEGMEGVGVSRFRDLVDDSAFSFFEKRVSFLLGAFDESLKEFEKEVGRK